MGFVSICQHLTCKLTLDKLIELFDDGKSLSFEEIKETLKCSKNTALKYINMALEQGLIKKERQGHKYLYVINNEFNEYQPVREDDLLKLYIIQLFDFYKYYDEASAVSKEKFIEKYKELSYSEKTYKKTKIDSILVSLEEDGFLKRVQKLNKEREQNQGCYYLANTDFLEWEETFRLRGEFLDEWNMMYRLLKKMLPNNPLHGILSPICNKLSMFMENFEDDESDISIVPTGGAYHGADNIISEIEKINNYNYAEKILKITIKNSDNDRKTVKNFAVSFIVYSFEQDCLYLYGYKVHPNSKDIMKQRELDAINVNKIDNISELDSINPVFMEEETRERLRKTIGMSTEKDADVLTIKFDDNLTKLEKEILERLKSQISFDVSGNIITCEVIGRGNMERLLRPLIGRIKSINNEDYRKDFCKSAENIIKNYEEYFNGRK